MSYDTSDGHYCHQNNIQSVKSAKNTVQHHSSVKELGYKKVKYGRLYLLLDHVLFNYCVLF